MFIASALKFIGDKAINASLRLDGTKALYKKSLNLVEDSSTRAALDKFVSIFHGNVGEKQMGMSMAEDIAQKIEMCTDQKVKNYASEMIKNAQSKSRQECFDTVKEAEVLLDSVNVAEGKYCPLFGPDNPFCEQFAGKNAIELKNELHSATKESIQNVTDTLGYSQPRAAYHALRVTEQTHEIDLQAFANSSQFFRMKEYIAGNPKEKAISEYLYNKYYLPNFLNLPPKPGEILGGRISYADEIEKLLSEIKKDYGTHVFLSEDSAFNKDILNRLKDEFQIWKTYGGKKAKFPPVFAVDRYSYVNFITDKAGGVHFHNRRHIAIPSTGTRLGPIRHEMVHFNDKDVALHVGQPAEISSLRQQQMIDAGLSEHSVNYASTNKAEELAVKGECQMSKLPQNFKDEMVRDGLDRFITELPTHNEYFEKLLMEKFANSEALATIEQLKQICFKKGIPEDASKAIIDNPELLAGAKKLIAKERNYTDWYNSGEHFIQDCREELELEAEKLRNEAVAKAKQQLQKRNKKQNNFMEQVRQWVEENKKQTEYILNVRKETSDNEMPELIIDRLKSLK